MKRKLLLWMLFFFSGMILFVYLLNETPLFYQEPTTYRVVAQPILLSPQAAPIVNLRPKKNALIIFLHSYGSSPHDFQKAADYFSRQYNVVAPLYPGHGTSEQDFKKTYFSQWYAFARDVYLQHRKNYSRIYLCGFSLGGAIALKLGEDFNQTSAPDGIIAISAPVFFNHPSQGVWYDGRLYFSRFFAWWVPEIKNKTSSADQDGAKRIGYEGKDFPAQVHSLKIALPDIERDLPLIKCPVLAMQSREDKTVPFENLFYIAQHVSSAFVRMRIFDLRAWQHTRHLLPLYQASQDEVISEIDQFLNQIEK